MRSGMGKRVLRVMVVVVVVGEAVLLVLVLRRLGLK